MRKNIVYLRYDFFYRSAFFFKFLNRLVKSGNLCIVEKIVYGLFKNLQFSDIFYKKNIYKKNYLPIFFFFEAINICRPWVGLRVYKPSSKFRKGSKKNKKQIALKTKSIPILISRNKSYKIAISWVISAVNLRSEISLKKRILGELQDILIEKRSHSLKKKEQLKSLLILNRSSRNYRWKK
jgi:ribosomal protein S7